MRRTTPTIPAVENAVEVVVDFDVETQSLEALNAAAYRLIGTATCQIDRVENRYVCRLLSTGFAAADAVGIRRRYLDLVTDENVRTALRAKTEPVRNIILSLAFGSLAIDQENKN